MAFEERALIGSGDVYLVFNDDRGTIYLGNATKFAIDETKFEKKERVSKQKETFGQALDVVVQKQPPQINIAFDTINRDNLAIALRGKIETLGSTGSVTDETITAVSGGAVSVEHFNISDVTVKSSDGSTTYSEDTDYTVEPKAGIIKFLKDGEITDGESLKVSYTYAEDISGIKGSKVAQLECGVRFVGVNQTTGEDMTVICYKAQIAPTKAIDFISDDFVDVEMEGTLLTPPDKTEPYVVMVG